MKRDRERQITIRRFVWSQTSPDEARQMADAREALEAALAGIEMSANDLLPV